MMRVRTVLVLIGMSHLPSTVGRPFGFTLSVQLLPPSMPSHPLASGPSISSPALGGLGLRAFVLGLELELLPPER